MWATKFSKLQKPHKYSCKCLPLTQVIGSQRVIDAYKSKQGSFRQLADRFQVSLSFVQRLINRDQKTGLVAPKPHGGGAAAKLTVEDLPIVQQLVNEQPDALLSELCDRLVERSALRISVPTMHRAVHGERVNH